MSDASLYALAGNIVDQLKELKFKKDRYKVLSMSLQQTQRNPERNVRNG